MDNTLAKKFTLRSLLRFAIPNVIMMITLSMYIIIDGIFISRILGTTALSAANMIYPAISFEMAIAIMLATGGSAIIAKQLGEGKEKEARENLSLLILMEIVIGICVAVFGNVFLEHIVKLLGASSAQHALCTSYAGILFTFAPAFFLQTAFQTFFVTAGKPTLGLVVTLIAGVTNILLDYLFMAGLSMGIAGAAYATAIGYCIPAIVGLWYFSVKKKEALHIVKPRMNGNVLLHACTNGSSEMVTNLANAATTFLFNFMFLKYYGEDGVASITIILYFQYIFTALYFGYANGIAPIISFKYGCRDEVQLQSIFKNSILFLVVSAIVMNLCIHITLPYTLSIFTTSDSNVYAITMVGFSYYSIGFLIMGVGIFASALFTAFSDGKSSAIISFTRTFLCIVGCILILPLLMGELGVWIAVPVAEGIGLLVAVGFLLAKRAYGYLPLAKI